MNERNAVLPGAIVPYGCSPTATLNAGASRRATTCVAFVEPVFCKTTRTYTGTPSRAARSGAPGVVASMIRM
jgi:hypothetical protein